ncbi:hypothetical protein [Rhizobium tubonense]|nr:hypothetical protein [Rhizobium tubonense]
MFPHRSIVMMNALIEDRIVISYVRQPAEHADVMRQAGRRFATTDMRPSFDGWYLLLGILAGAGLYFFFYAYRRLVLIPLLGLSPTVGTGDILLTCFLPCLLAYALVIIYLRHASTVRLAAMKARIRPDVVVTATISHDGISWDSPGSSLRLDWRSVSDIATRNGRIEFDVDSFVCYIPGHAFRNQQEQAAVLERILAFWAPQEVVNP